jgi:hypothetical protein
MKAVQLVDWRHEPDIGDVGPSGPRPDVPGSTPDMQRCGWCTSTCLAALHVSSGIGAGLTSAQSSVGHISS